jgi:Bacterial CdiA-CT RNAse A domain
VSEASTFTDRPTAELVISQALEAKGTKIETWVRTTLPEPWPREVDLAIEWPAGQPIGLVLQKVGAAPVVTTSARIVLVRDDSLLGFHIKTAYTQS